ncbi:PIG-P-domain-containing protein, partial [Rozella allomycis CSF55]
MNQLRSSPEDNAVGIIDLDPSPHADEEAFPKKMKDSTLFEFYGFMIYLVSYVAFFIYLAWAILPESVLHSMGITYYPDKYWAIALPVFFISLIPFIYLMLFSWNLMNTPPLNSENVLTDEYAYLADHIVTDFRDENIPELMDLPVNLINHA